MNQFNKGVKVRFTHPGLSADGLGKHLGRAMAALVDGNQAYADVHFTKSSHATPEGDLSGYVMDLAEDSPEDFAISIVYDVDVAAELEHFLAHGGRIVEGAYGEEIWDNSEFQSPDPKNKQGLPHARVAMMRAADFVADPAANPGGLFSREQKFAAEAEELAAFALGISDKRPAAVALGLDADRVEQFVKRFLTSHNLELVPMRKQSEAAVEEKPAEVIPAPVAEEKPAEAPAAEPTPAVEAAPVAEQSAERSEAKRFREAFGDRGAVWFAHGLSFEQARSKQIEELTAGQDSLRKENEELKRKLGAANVEGETTPVGFDAADKKERKGFAGKINIVGGKK